MPVDDQELRAIQFLGERVRKATPGAAAWDTAGFTANLVKIRTRNLHLVIEHVIRHAADPNAKTPGVLAGSFTPAAPDGKTGPPVPAKADESCRVCWRHLDACICGERAEKPPTPASDHKAHADTIRQRVFAHRNTEEENDE